MNKTVIIALALWPLVAAGQTPTPVPIPGGPLGGTITGGTISGTNVSGANVTPTGSGTPQTLAATAATANAALPATTAASTYLPINNPTATGTVTAPTFSGALSGNATSATTATTATTAGNVTGMVAIANGGTGSTSASAALTALGAAPKVSPTFSGTVTIPTIITTLATPASSSAPCAAGQIGADASYVYVCTATNTWKRAPISTW